MARFDGVRASTRERECVREHTGGKKRQAEDTHKQKHTHKPRRRLTSVHSLKHIHDWQHEAIARRFVRFQSSTDRSE